MKILQYCFKYHFWKTIIIFLIILILLYIWRKWKGNKGSWSSFSEIEKTYNLLNKDVISITKQIIHTDKVNPSDISLNLTSNLSKKSSDSKGEIICRNTLQTIFKKPFNKIRPDFLRNKALDNNMNLEIDCYNDELKLGVEYNGRQHYEFVPFFHKNKEAFHNQKYRDYMKKDLCKKNGIRLISVPYTIKPKHIESFLTEKIKKIYKI
jgi:hypothetical protein